MNPITFAVPLLYQLVILGLCAFLLIRGFTHVFICLFAGGALLELIRSMAYVAMSMAPGGFSANAGFLPIVSAVGYLGMLIFLTGFVSLTAYLLRTQPPQA